VTAADGLRRGFKADAERIAESVRAELGLEPSQPLDCLALAHHLGIEVIALRELRRHGAKEQSIRTLISDDAGFSATTVCAGTRRLIVYNPRDAPGRRANSLAHELSHVLLEHEPKPALGAGGCRHWANREEAEADWLGAALLVPREGALDWMTRDGDLDRGAEHFGVSIELFRWRVNHTGVSRQLARTRGTVGAHERGGTGCAT
jgi:Zn-dependent peptidase ImmA (M78 family)